MYNLWFEILRNFTDYRDYMGLSSIIWLCKWSLSGLISYNLVGSLTKPFRLYLSTDDMVIGSALIHEFEVKERVICYLCRRLVDAETRYSAIEKLCLYLYFSCVRLRHYLLSAECTVVCKDDVVRYMLSMPIMSGRICNTVGVKHGLSLTKACISIFIKHSITWACHPSKNVILCALFYVI